MVVTAFGPDVGLSSSVKYVFFRVLDLFVSSCVKWPSHDFLLLNHIRVYFDWLSVRRVNDLFMLLPQRPFTTKTLTQSFPTNYKNPILNVPISVLSVITTCYNFRLIYYNFRSTGYNFILPVTIVVLHVTTSVLPVTTSVLPVTTPVLIATPSFRTFTIRLLLIVT